MRDVAARGDPRRAIALSPQTRPKLRELGRFVTTAIRAALLPVIGDYLERLEGKLARRGASTAPLYVIKSQRRR